ncbi:prepilin-type N-terminal cleavage/methylation domain-containing protein [Elusimicrobium posterum]|uniref:type IV pilin protein n=1 Tax=Elusimicrobium posterum TaxID=3116653 RepID=UPI003C769A30
MKKGFTLIELLVVVLIIGILAAIALPQYTKAVERSRAAEGLVAVRTLAEAFRRAELAGTTQVTSFDDLDIDMPGTLTVESGLNGETKLISKYWKVLVYPYGVIAYYQGGKSINIYFDRNSSDHKIWCAAAPDVDTSMCKGLGGTDSNMLVANCGFGAGWSCYILQTLQ